MFAAILAVDAACDRATRMVADPIGPVRRYREPRDLEIAGLVGACLAFGNVKTLRAKVADAFDRLGPNLAHTADDQLLVFAKMGGWKHRVYQGEDVARLVIGARRVQRAHGSLEQGFRAALDKHGTLRPALAEWVREIRVAGGLDRAAEGGRRGAAHILSDPDKTSGCKRLLLFLRWMVRPDDGVDLGLWKSVSPSVLLIPVDTHLYKLSRNLGFTRRTTLNWATTEEITTSLRRLDPADPVRFDFPLCHLGMLQRCPSRRDPVRCEGCGIQSVCIHWTTGRGKAAPVPPAKPAAGSAKAAAPRGKSRKSPARTIRAR